MLKTIIVGAFAALTVVTSAQANTLRALAGNLPPYAIEETESGFNLELSRLAAERAGYSLEIEFQPWRRAQQNIQNGEAYLAFNLTRTEAREPMYKWIAPLIDFSNVFVSVDEPINSFEQAAAMGEILARGGTPQERRLDAEGVPSRQIKSPEQAVMVLDARRANGWFTHDRRAAWVWNRQESENELVLGSSQGGGTIYLAASPGFPDDVAAELAAAIEELRADGTYDRLMVEYFGSAE